MRPRRKEKHTDIRIPILLATLVVVGAFIMMNHTRVYERSIVLVQEGREFEVSGVSASIGELLVENQIAFDELDRFEPALTSEITSGMRVHHSPSMRVVVIGPDGAGEFPTASETVGGFLEEIGYALSAERRVRPDPETLLEPGMEVELILFDEEEEVIEKSIAFKTTYKTTNEKPFGYSSVVQEGEKGKKKETYRLIYENGELVSRELVDEEILEEPVTEIVEKGSKIVVGQSLGETKASFYADFFHGRITANGEVFRNDRLTAAHKTLPFGTIVRVTNLRNGKSIVVPINDRGPYIDGREIDLSKAAFATIAPLSNGVIPIELEIVK